MDIKKYELIPTEFATAKEIGLAPQTLSAFAKRGMVEVKAGAPNKYRRIDNSAIKVYNFLEKNKNKINHYFGLCKTNEPLGMMCSIVSGEVVDCWGKKYDLQNVYKIRIGTEYYEL